MERLEFPIQVEAGKMATLLEIAQEFGREAFRIAVYLNAGFASVLFVVAGPKKDLTLSLVVWALGCGFALMGWGSGYVWKMRQEGRKADSGGKHPTHLRQSIYLRVSVYCLVLSLAAFIVGCLLMLRGLAPRA
jgi:hypothetical protein